MTEHSSAPVLTSSPPWSPRCTQVARTSEMVRGWTAGWALLGLVNRRLLALLTMSLRDAACLAALESAHGVQLRILLGWLRLISCPD